MEKKIHRTQNKPRMKFPITKHELGDMLTKVGRGIDINAVNKMIFGDKLNF